MTAYTPTGTVFHSGFDLPTPGTPATAASVNDQALKYLADNAMYLRNLTLPLETGGDFLPSTFPINILGYQGFNVPSGSVTIGGALTVGANAGIVGDLQVSGLGIFTDRIAVQGDIGSTFGEITGINKTRFSCAAKTDAGGTITISRNVITVGASLPGSNTNWFIDSSGQQRGDWVFVYLGTIGNTITVTSSDGTMLTLSTGGNHWAFIVRVFDGTSDVWTVLMRGNTP